MKGRTVTVSSVKKNYSVLPCSLSFSWPSTSRHKQFCYIHFVFVSFILLLQSTLITSLHHFYYEKKTQPSGKLGNSIFCPVYDTCNASQRHVRYFPRYVCVLNIIYIYDQTFNHIHIFYTYRNMTYYYFFEHIVIY